MSRLPIELYAEVLQNVTDTKSLQALILTSRTMRVETTRRLYQDIHLKSIEALDGLAAILVSKPNFCIQTRSFTLSDSHNIREGYWSEDRETLLEDVLSRMQSLVHLSMDVGMTGHVWNILKLSLKRSGARLQEFACWHSSTPVEYQHFIESQSSIPTFRHGTSYGGSLSYAEHLQPSVLPNITLLEGYYTAIRHLFDGRPIQRQRLQNRFKCLLRRAQDSVIFSHLANLEVLHLACTPGFLPALPTITFLECGCSDSEPPELLRVVRHWPCLSTLVLSKPVQLNVYFVNVIFGQCSPLEVIQVRIRDVEFWRRFPEGRTAACIFDWETWTLEDTATARKHIDAVVV